MTIQRMDFYVCLCFCASLVATSLVAEPIDLIYTYADKHTETRTLEITPTNGVYLVRVRRNELPAGVEWVKVLPSFAHAQTGEPGYFVSPCGRIGSFKLTNGTFKAIGASAFYGSVYMPIFGMKTPRKTFVGIAITLRNEFDLEVFARNGTYTIGPTFKVAGFVPPDDIVVRYHTLEGAAANYAGMAKTYRAYLLERELCQPIKTRMKQRPELAYAAKSIELRIRQGWKPVPSPVLEQTPATEPPMHVAVTFDRVRDILTQLKQAGVHDVEVCLVGWNIKGHDGRWPQIFPVEESLGGEQKLRSLIKDAQTLGYQIVGHANSTDGYTIADCWSWDLPIKDAEGKPFSNASWGGGKMYHLCPQRVYERFYPHEIEKIADLGFRGLHYSDVMTILQPFRCQDPMHPCTSKESAIWYSRMMQETQQRIGGFASEGPYDFANGHLDYILYVNFGALTAKQHPMVDRLTPLYQLVYNGIVLNNPFTEAVNASAKEPFIQLKAIEFGGRPIYYFYSKFKTDNKSWMGDIDLTCATEAELEASIAIIKKGYDSFKPLADLQCEFMEAHDELATNVFRTTFGNKTEIVINYSTAPFSYRETSIAPLRYSVFQHP